MERVSFQRAEREIDAEIGANFPRHEMVEGGQMRLVPAAGKFDSNKKNSLRTDVKRPTRVDNKNGSGSRALTVARACPRDTPTKGPIPRDGTRTNRKICCPKGRRCG